MAEQKETKSAFISIDDVIKGYAEKAKGKKEPTVISLTDKFEIEFEKDFGHFKKGDKATVSQVSKDFYLQNKAAKEV